MTRIGLTLNRTKIKLVKAKQEERFDFLGYTFGPHRFKKDGQWYLGVKSVGEERGAVEAEGARGVASE